MPVSDLDGASLVEEEDGTAGAASVSSWTNRLPGSLGNVCLASLSRTEVVFVQ